jgi:hypothetical protein
MFKVLVIVALLLTWTAGARGAGDIEWNVDAFFGWDGWYRPMEWTPVNVLIGSDLTEPFAGTFSLSNQQDGLNTLNVMHRFVLTPDVPLPIPLVTKLSFGVSECKLMIRNEKGRVQWDQTLDMWDFSPQNRILRPVHEGDLFIGLVGQPRFGLLRLPNETVCETGGGRGKVRLGPKVPRAVPWDWTGFVSLDLLILYDPDWSLLQAAQFRAIDEWVANGGTLLVVLGGHPLPENCPLRRTLPFDLGNPRETTIAPDVLEGWGLSGAKPETVTSWPLFPKSGALLSTQVKAAEVGYLAGSGPAGFGRVAVLGFDPADLSEAQTRHTAKFWVALIDGFAGASETRYGSDSGSRRSGGLGTVGRRIVLEEDASAPDNQNNQNRYRISLAQLASNQVLEFLYDLEQMRPLSIWWVILTLSMLAVLLGPVDYFVLKRLDRLPYTWLTSTGWIIIFTVGAYYGVQELRGGAMELRAVSVVDGIADSNCVWATYHAGLFAPRSDNYQLEGLGPGQWWSGIAPSREEYWSHQVEAGMRQIYCVQEDGANVPVSLPINIWTVQSLLGETRLSETPISARVNRQGDDVVVEIFNRSDSPIRGGFALLEDGYIDLGSVASRFTRQFADAPLPFELWDDRPVGRSHGHWAGLRMPRYPGSIGRAAADTFQAQGCLERTLAMHAYLDFGAALVCVEFEDAPVPIGVENRSYDVNHRKYARQIVLPRGAN